MRQLFNDGRGDFRGSADCYYHVEASESRDGRTLLLEVTRMRLGNGPPRQGATATVVLDVAAGAHQRVRLGPIDRELNESAADALRGLLDFARDERSGLLVPKLEPGQTVLVDREGSRQLRALDAGSGEVERIDKRELRVEERRCTCPVREMLAPGFKHRCGIES